MTLRPGGPAATAVEAVVVGVVGAALGGAVWGLLHPVLGVVMAAVAGVNGVICGWRHVYPWQRWSGLVAFVLDSTWATVPVAGGLLAHLVAARSRASRYEPSLSRRHGQHVYRGGLHFKKGFALTVGNVISGAGDVSRPRRRKLITDHEAVHVWQARWFGPCYLPLYGLWAGVGVLGGVLLWLRRGRNEPLGTMIESCSYYTNPFEWWAYSRDDLWPPPGLVTGVGWRNAAVRQLADVRVRRHVDSD